MASNPYNLATPRLTPPGRPLQSQRRKLSRDTHTSQSERSIFMQRVSQLDEK